MSSAAAQPARSVDVERCYREIELYRRAAESVDKPAWLVTLGIEDWLMEIRLIEAETTKGRSVMGATSAKPTQSAGSQLPRHIHLPSVHVRRKHASYDFDEDIFVRRGVAHREIKLVVFNRESKSVHITRDILCEEEIEALLEYLPNLMTEGDPWAEASMEDAAAQEFARQQRIATFQEMACANCGCSESRACSGGCVWAAHRLCSRCA